MNEPTPSASSAGQKRAPSPEDIARRAAKLWENYGRPSGRDVEIWLEAEESLRVPVAPFTDGETPPRSARNLESVKTEPAHPPQDPAKRPTKSGRR